MTELISSPTTSPANLHPTVQSYSGCPAENEELASDRRILIVDDEPVIRALFASWLSEERFECTTAASADEALVYLANDTFALVISDMMMPGRNGVELLREIKARYPDTAVIMVSGVDRPQRVRDALMVGAFDYLIKPCELGVLTLSVEHALERRTLQRTTRIYKAHLENQNIELANSKTQLERLQGQLVHTEKMASLGQLAAGVAHELNNPAGFIFGNMDLLGDYLGQLRHLLQIYDQTTLSVEDTQLVNSLKTEIRYDKLVGDLDSIIADCSEGAERICAVVKNLRLFSRLDEAELKKVDIHSGIESTLRLMSRYFSGGPVTLRRDYGDLPVIDCYAGQLNQVWMNLLVNAAQSIAGPGEVSISTRLDQGSVIVAISDTGSGIPEAQLSRIFEPFFTTKAVGEGTGLGLSISYGIIQRHGGTINVASQIGRGTTFSVRIPIRGTESEGTRNDQNFLGRILNDL
ncbi:MAG TPA: response regulator [Pyrinomonadaceae bacterium]|nr:response regulator [Pyrinomonadaceae bacterium]